MMYDTSSRQAIVSRLHEERLAEARRAHLLRAARGEDDFEVRGTVVPSAGLTSRLSGALGSVRHGLAHVFGHPNGATAH
jgi:hypothetical protein